MIDEVNEGIEYTHIKLGKFRVDEIILDASGYEAGEKPRPMVVYTQLGEGQYPPGTKWVKSLEEFRNTFE